VRFPDTPEGLSQVVETVISREDLTKEVREALWFCASEYESLRNEKWHECHASERDGLAKVLLEGVYKEKCKEAQEKLNRWVLELGPERRGLEKSSNTTLSEQRQSIQFESIMEVLRAQDEMLISRSRTIDEEELRKVYNQACRVPRHFARMMAKADALAVGASADAVLDADAVAKKKHLANIKSKESFNGESSAHFHSSLRSLPAATASFQKERGKAQEKKKKSKDKVKKDSSSNNNYKKDTEKEKDPKQKSTLKQKYKETKAGIISRIPRRIA